MCFLVNHINESILAGAYYCASQSLALKLNLLFALALEIHIPIRKSIVA